MRRLAMKKEESLLDLLIVFLTGCISIIIIYHVLVIPAYRNTYLEEGSHRHIVGKDTLYVQVSKQDWPWKLGRDNGKASINTEVRGEDSDRKQ